MGYGHLNSTGRARAISLIAGVSVPVVGAARDVWTLSRTMANIAFSPLCECNRSRVGGARVQSLVYYTQDLAVV